MVLWGVTCVLVTCAVTSRTFRELSGSFDAPVLAASPPDHAGGLQKEIFEENHAGCRDQQNIWEWAADEGTKFLKFSNVTKRGHAILSYVKKSNGLREHSLIPRCSVIIFSISQKESQLKGEISIEKNKKSLHILVDHPLAKNLSHAEIWIMFLSTSASRIFDETMF